MITPKRASSIICLLSLSLLWTGQASAQGRDAFLKSNPKFMESFREVVANPSQSTVRVLSDGKDTALGMIVGQSGWILTKANDLKGEITVKLKDGRVFLATLSGVHKEHDLAMLKIDAEGLSPISFRESKDAVVGNWVACVGPDTDPVGIGVISVATRKLANKGPIISVDLAQAGYLGVGVEPAEGGVRISNVMPNTAAVKAGIKVKDLVLTLAGKKITDPDEFIGAMSLYKPGDVVTMLVRRDKEEMELKATLGKRPADMLRGDFQNKMGSELSSRRTGYPTILQHDTILKPADCGGPIVDLEGKVIGINVCRAGRTESWAVPSEVIQPLLFDLMSGKLAPPAAKSTQPAPTTKVGLAKLAIQRAQAEKDKAERRLIHARANLERLLRDQPTAPNPGQDGREIDPTRGINGR